MTDLLAATILIVGSLLYIAWEIRRAPDRSRLPGNLARDHTWAEIEDWEQHVQSAPGMGDLGETPIFDALCFEAWESDVSEDAS